MRFVVKGFTMVELILAMAIIAIATLAMTSALSFAISHQADAMPRAQMTALAQAYFDEIMAKRYDEQTPLGGLPACSASTSPCSASSAFDDGESRLLFDDVDDFHGLDEQPPLDAAGNPMTEYAAFRVQVSVTYPTALEQTSLGLTRTTDAKLVSLTVTTTDTKQMQFTLLRTNF